MSAWAPLFAVSLGIRRRDMLEMSVPEMVEHVEYWASVTGRDEDG